MVTRRTSFARRAASSGCAHERRALRPEAATRARSGRCARSQATRVAPSLWPIADPTVWNDLWGHQARQVGSRPLCRVCRRRPACLKPRPSTISFGHLLRGADRVELCRRARSANGSLPRDRRVHLGVVGLARRLRRAFSAHGSQSQTVQLARVFDVLFSVLLLVWHHPSLPLTLVRILHPHMCCFNHFGLSNTEIEYLYGHELIDIDL